MGASRAISRDNNIISIILFLSKGKTAVFFVSVAVSLYLGELQTKSISKHQYKSISAIESLAGFLYCLFNMVIPTYMQFVLLPYPQQLKLGYPLQTPLIHLLKVRLPRSTCPWFSLNSIACYSWLPRECRRMSAMFCFYESLIQECLSKNREIAISPCLNYMQC